MSAAVVGIVLAGGQGSRLGGLDKGLQLFDGKPLLTYMLQSLAPACSSILISANRNIEIYRQYGYPVIPDAADGFAGPLAGLLVTLPLAGCDYAIVVPCDMPRLTPDILQCLLLGLRQSSVDAVVAADPQRIHYSVVACRVAPALLALQQAWAAGERSLRAWQCRLSGQVLYFSELDAFINCNFPETLDSPD